MLRLLYYKQLASDLEHYLTDEIPLYLDEWPSRFCMDIMAYQIVEAIEAGKPLQLDFSVGRDPRCQWTISCNLC